MQMLHKAPTKNIKYLLDFGRKSLALYSPTPELDCEILLSNSLKVEKEYLIINNNKIPKVEEIRDFEKKIFKRKKGLPISYIINKKEFYGLDFLVGKGVLIPRPETEQIIEIVKDLVSKQFSKIRIVNTLEIGSGSGCIPITLKMCLNSKINIKSFEVSKKAYKFAISNYRNLKPGKIDFINKDAFLLKNHTDGYDLIISNPPYLTVEDMKLTKIEVKNEPRKALFGGEDGLEYYFILKKFLKSKLNINGYAVFEINEKLGEKTAAIFSNEYSCQLVKDYFGKDRFIIISPLQ